VWGRNALSKEQTHFKYYQIIQACDFKIQHLDSGLLARSQYPEGPATATSTQVFLGFPVFTSECWDGSPVSKLLLHASHLALPT